MVCKPLKSIAHNLSFTSIFYRCKSMKEFKQTHARLVIEGLPHPPSSLRPIISFSALHPSGDIGYALLIIFRTLTPPTVFLLNTVIRGLARARCSDSPRNSVLIFNRMVEFDLAPNNFTFTFLFQICANSMAFNLGQQFHSMVIKKSWVMDAFIRNSIIHFYSVCRKLGDAQRVFHESDELDVVSWNSLINGYVKNGDISEALGMFDKMPERNVASWNCLIGGLVKFGRLDDAHQLFVDMPERNLVSWVVMIAGYAQNGRPMEALALFREMQLLDQEPNAAILH